MRRFLRATLEGCNYGIVEATSREQAIDEVWTAKPDVILLDLDMPKADGFALLGQLREWTDLPVIAFSGGNEEAQKVRALEAGADDCLDKPPSARELLARIKTALRRAARTEEIVPGRRFTLDDLEVDLVSRLVSIGGKPVHLNRTEYGLVLALVRANGEVVAHEQLLRDLWGNASASGVQYLRALIAGLRRKFETDPTRPRYLVTERGLGYRIPRPST